MIKRARTRRALWQVVERNPPFYRAHALQLVDRGFEDPDALGEEAGGSACLFGTYSGAALALAVLSDTHRSSTSRSTE